MRFSYSASTFLAVAFPIGIKTKVNGEVMPPSKIVDGVTELSHDSSSEAIFTQNHLKEVLPSATSRLRQTMMGRRKAAKAKKQFDHRALGRLANTSTRRSLKETCTYADNTTGVKCDGVEACYGIDISKVGCGSCNSYNACYDYDGFKGITPLATPSIGENSCNGNSACTEITSNTVIGSNSCNGLGEVGPQEYTGYSCTHRTGGTIGNDSCNGYAACYFTYEVKGSTNVGNKSCNGQSACEASTGNIGSCTCNGAADAKGLGVCENNSVDLSGITCAPTGSPTKSPTAQPSTPPPITSPPTKSPSNSSAPTTKKAKSGKEDKDGKADKKDESKSPTPPPSTPPPITSPPTKSPSNSSSPTAKKAKSGKEDKDGKKDEEKKQKRAKAFRVL